MDSPILSHGKHIMTFQHTLESGPDDNNYETNFRGEDRPVFPHNFKIKNEKDR